MKTLRALLFSFAATLVVAAEQPTTGELKNSSFAVTLRPDGTIRMVHLASGAERAFNGRFRVLVCDRDPTLSYARSAPEAYTVPQWNRGAGEGRTHDLFEAAGTVIEAAPGSAKLNGSRIEWTYAPSARFEFSASVEVPAGNTEPKLSFALKVRQAGWYSVGYAGAPELPPDAMDGIYQPRIWEEKRFPRLAFLTPERMCSLPAALLTAGGVTTGVAADPSDGPYRIPTFADSRFGFAVRNPQGLAQPQYFSPILGNSNAKVLTMDQGLARRIGDAKVDTTQPSRLEAGSGMSSAFRLVVWPGDWYATFVHLTRSLYGFSDLRENVAGSLNKTLENIVAYALNDALAGWVADMKASDYDTDVPGTVKNVSALHPLSVALITDNEDIFRRRGLPMAEYLISREKYLFTTDPAIKHQNPSPNMRGPAAEVSELVALYQLSQQRSSVFEHLARTYYGKPRARNLNMVSGTTWQDTLAMYRLTGSREHLDAAVKGALDYVTARVNTPQTDFTDVKIATGGQFWSDFAPKWIDLLELFEETRDPRFLKAAHSAGAHYASYAAVYPRVPDATVRINKGNAVGRYAYQCRLTDNPKKMLATEQDVPAWHVSWHGLLPEATTTHTANPAVFLAHHAAYFLRLAHYTGDSFLHDIGRSAVVGRYLNYPGYTVMGEFSNVYSRPDYPMRPLTEVTYNTVYYPHIWPQIALVFDYLFSDVFTRSGGRIEFPSRYAQGYAYLHTKVYGDRPGRFHDDQGVRPWMPAQLLDIDDVQVNYVTGLGSDRFYIALLNESTRPVKTKVRINPVLVPLKARGHHTARKWIGGGAAQPTQIPASGIFEIEIAPRGMVSLAMDEVKVQTQFQHKVLGGERRPLGPESHVVVNPSWSPIHASIISFGDELSEAYIYLEATDRELKSVRLEVPGQKKPLEDSSYPFEFSLPWKDGQVALTVKISATDKNGNAQEPVELTLKSGAGG